MVLSGNIFRKKVPYHGYLKIILVIMLQKISRIRRYFSNKP